MTIWYPWKCVTRFCLKRRSKIYCPTLLCVFFHIPMGQFIQHNKHVDMNSGKRLQHHWHPYPSASQICSVVWYSLISKIHTTRSVIVVDRKSWNLYLYDWRCTPPRLYMSPFYDWMERPPPGLTFSLSHIVYCTGKKNLTIVNKSWKEATVSINTPKKIFESCIGRDCKLFWWPVSPWASSSNTCSSKFSKHWHYFWECKADVQRNNKFISIGNMK